MRLTGGGGGEGSGGGSGGGEEGGEEEEISSSLAAQPVGLSPEPRAKPQHARLSELHSGLVPPPPGKKLENSKKGNVL